MKVSLLEDYAKIEEISRLLKGDERSNKYNILKVHHSGQEQAINKWSETMETITDQIDDIYIDCNTEESETGDYTFE